VKIETKKGKKEKVPLKKIANNVVFLVDTAPQTTELLRVAKALNDNGNWEIIFAFNAVYTERSNHIIICENAGYIVDKLVDDHIADLTWIERKINQFEIYFYNRIIREKRNKISISQLFYLIFRIYRSLSYRIRRVLRAAYYRILDERRLHKYIEIVYFHMNKRYWRKRYKSWINLSKQVLTSHDVNLLILAKDCAYYDTVCWVKGANELEIKTILVPFDEASPRTLAEHRYDHHEHVIRTDIDKKIAKKYPKWTYHFIDQDLLLLASPQVEILNELELTPPNPWAYNSSKCDRIFLDSEFQKRKYIDDSALAEQLVVTGAVFQDLLSLSYKNAEDKRKVLLDSLGWTDDKLLILGSLAPNKLAERDVELEFVDYIEMITYWTKTLVENDRFNVILCLHPNVNYNEVKFLEEYGVKIIQEDTASLISISDIYVVDCSATSRWALAAGKLVIDYDLMRYDLDFHSKLDGIIHIQARNDFENTLNMLSEGKLNTQRNNVREKANSGYWGKFDGMASKRINKECMKLINPTIENNSL
jgi:hypothetical protein